MNEKHPFKIRDGIKGQEIFDPFRKKYVALTPEEWVRQNILNYLVQEKKFPASLISVEHSISYSQMKKRCDAVVFDKKGQAVLIVECKSEKTTLHTSVLEQICRYNSGLAVHALLITNGVATFCFLKNKPDSGDAFFPVADIPDYDDLIHSY